jgi:ABC-type Mn2+/Zn2+ transport system permease subunit
MTTVLTWITEPWQAPLLARGGLIAMLTGAAAAAIGCWVLLRDLPYAAESLSHGMFPGLVAAAILGVPIALGGLAGLALAAGAIVAARRWITDENHSVAIAIIPLLGLGAVLALSGPVPPGTGSALFGDVLSTDSTDLIAAFAVAGLVAVALYGLHWRLLASGLTGKGITADAIVLVFLAVATAAVARSLGALLAVALILGPASAASRLADRAGRMIVIAAGTAIVSVTVGVEASWHLDVATGPAIALCAIIPAAIAAGIKPGKAGI